MLSNNFEIKLTKLLNIWNSRNLSLNASSFNYSEVKFTCIENEEETMVDYKILSKYLFQSFTDFGIDLGLIGIFSVVLQFKF